MAYTFQQAASNSTAGATSLAVTFANAPASGELIVATVATNSSTATITAPSGFSTKVSNANTSRSIGIYWKIAGGSESTSYTWNFSASIAAAIVMRRFSSNYGWNTDQSGGASNYAWDNTSVSSVSMSITTTANRLVVGDGYSSNTTSTNKQLNPNSNWLDNTLLYSNRTRSAYRTAAGGAETLGYQLTDSAVDTRLAIMAAEFVEYTTKTANASTKALSTSWNGRKYSDPSKVPSIDTTPDAFSFTDQTDVALSSTITSAAITVSGINSAATITSSGGTFDINSSGTFISSGTVNNGDTVRARVTSSSSNSTAVNCVVTIGGVSDTFTATTLAASGSSLTITGTGFGSSPGAAPFFVQKFGTNNGSSDASTVGYAAAQGAFGTNSYGSTMTINTSAGRGGRGALVMAMSFTPGGDRDFFPHVALDTSNRGRGALSSQTLYYAYWVKLNRTSGSDTTTYQIKGPRAGYAASTSDNYYNAQPIYKVSHWANGSGTYAYTYQESVPTNGAYDNSEHFNFDSPAWRAYDWNFVEGYMKFNDIGSANGVYYQRINGVDINAGFPDAGNSRAITARVSGESAKLFNFIFLTPGIDCPSTTAAVGLTLSFSEHYVDTTPQRVVMANHATNPYSGSIWTVQEWDSWSATSIHIPTLDFTGFTSGTTVYLHVFDASNTLVKSQSITVP